MPWTLMLTGARGEAAGPLTTAPLLTLNRLPWQGQLMVPLETLPTVHPAWVHTAVLATTPGVQVNDHARDDLGRPAVEISRTATSTGIAEQAFENPKTGGVLETASIYRDGTKGFDLYLSVTSSRTVPPNPYLP